MKKLDFVKDLANKLEIDEIKAKVAVETILESMATRLIYGGRVEIRGFGSFAVKKYEGRAGRNPQTGRLIKVAPKVLPRFKMSKELKKLLVKKFESPE